MQFLTEAKKYLRLYYNHFQDFTKHHHLDQKFSKNRLFQSIRPQNGANSAPLSTRAPFMKMEGAFFIIAFSTLSLKYNL